MKALNVVTRDEKVMSVYSAYWALRIFEKIKKAKDEIFPEKKDIEIMDDEEMYNFFMVQIISEFHEYLKSDMGYEERQGIERMTGYYFG